jgi:hypothetical protein
VGGTTQSTVIENRLAFHDRRCTDQIETTLPVNSKLTDY